MRRKLTLVVSSLFVIFLVFFLSREISPKQFNKNNLDSNISLDQPIWKVNQTNSPISYNISANRAFQNRTDKKFILEKVVIEEFLDSQVHSSIKSDNALTPFEIISCISHCLLSTITSNGQSIKKGFRWAENELEGIMRG